MVRRCVLDFTACFLGDTMRFGIYLFSKREFICFAGNLLVNYTDFLTQQANYCRSSVRLHRCICILIDLLHGLDLNFSRISLNSLKFGKTVYEDTLWLCTTEPTSTSAPMQEEHCEQEKKIRESIFFVSLQKGNFPPINSV